MAERKEILRVPIPKESDYVHAPEKGAERPDGAQEGSLRQVEIPSQEPDGVPSASQAIRPAQPIHQDPELESIERILSDGLDSIFLALPPSEQSTFKQTGERAAQKIHSMIRAGAYRIKDIIMIIASWLKTLPGINKFFLEQEAKIKADTIVKHFKP